MKLIELQKMPRTQSRKKRPDQTGDIFEPKVTNTKSLDQTFTLGGPVFKDRLWFFSNFEHVITESQPSTTNAAILAENPAQVRLVLRYAAFHKDSGLVVKMLEATKGQGLYWQALEATLKSQPVWADHGKPQVQALWNFLAPVGVDVEKAKRDMESTRIAEILKQDMADGVALEVERTPTFYVNGKLVSPVTPDGLRAKVREQINAAYP